MINEQELLELIESKINFYWHHPSNKHGFGNDGVQALLGLKYQIEAGTLTPTASAEGWRDIETAPRDGLLNERVAQITAHRACGNQEQDVMSGKLAGYCVVCQVPWPCTYAGTPPAPEVRDAG